MYSARHSGSPVIASSACCAASCAWRLVASTSSSSVGEHRPQVLRALGAAAVQQLEEELLLVGEVVVDGAAAEPRLLGDRLQAGGVKAALGEHACRGGKDLLARLLAPLGLGLSLAFHAWT